MKAKSSLRALVATAWIAALTLGASGAAQAQGETIYWSIGMSSPGVQVGVASAPPMVMYPPVYMAPRPVLYMPPQPVYYAYPGWRQYEHGRQRGYEHERHGGGHEGRGYEGRGQGHRY